MKITKLTILLFAFALKVNAQVVTIELDDFYANPNGLNSDLVSYAPIFKLESDSIHNKDQSIKINKLPSKINRSKLAYSFLYFEGVLKSEFKNQLVLLIENYDSSIPNIYVDRNGNLDFSDDGTPLRLKNELILDLANVLDPSAVYHYKIMKSKIKPKYHERFKSRYSSLYSTGKILSPSYWFATQRYFAKISERIIANKPISIFLFDNDVDGMFTFNTKELGDRIFISEGALVKGEDITKYNRQGEPIDHNAVFKLYNKKYEVVSLTNNGSQLKISETNKNTRVLYKEGVDISTFKLDLLSKTTIDIKSLLKKDKHLLIDVGGTWCGGCIKQEPTIKKLHTNNLVEVLGIFGHDSVESVTAYIKKHDIQWPVALMSKSFKDLFRVTSYPTYILISPEGKILFMDLDSQKVVDYLTKENTKS